MKTGTPFPSRLRWTAQNLVDAIPLRLSQAIDFVAAAGARGENDSRFDSPSRRKLRGCYLPGRTSLPLFRVGG